MHEQDPSDTVELCLQNNTPVCARRCRFVHLCVQPVLGRHNVQVWNVGSGLLTTLNTAWAMALVIHWIVLQ